MTSSSDALAIVTLALYILLAPLIVYCLVRHGKHGVWGWAYLLAFAALQLAAAGLEIGSAQGRGRDSSIINIISLSPLLLAVLGIEHEL